MGSIAAWSTARSIAHPRSASGPPRRRPRTWTHSSARSVQAGAEFQPESVIRLLGRHRVRYILIGGLAAITHGAPLITQDIDACYARDELNLRRIARALVEVHAELRGADPGL